MKYAKSCNPKYPKKFLSKCNLLIFCTLSLSVLVVQTRAGMASPCFPNDPDGTNPGNLCLTYPPSWSPLPNTPIDQPPFVQGIGKQAYYGYPVSSTQPGTIIGQTDGFWTGVQAVNGSTIITDNKGNTFTAR